MLFMSENKTYKTGEICPEDGTYRCKKSREYQKYKKGDVFDYCPIGQKTEWVKIQ